MAYVYSLAVLNGFSVHAPPSLLIFPARLSFSSFLCARGSRLAVRCLFSSVYIHWFWVIMAGVDLSNAELVGIIIETLLYGIFFVLFPLAIHVLLYRRESSSFGSISAFNKTVIVVAGSLFLSITAVRFRLLRPLGVVKAHSIASIGSLIFYDYGMLLSNFATSPVGPLLTTPTCQIQRTSRRQLSLCTRSSQVTRSLCVIFPLCIFRLVLTIMQVYRLFIVWSRNKSVIIFPIFSIVGLLGKHHIIRLWCDSTELVSVCGVGITYEFTRIGDGSIFAEEAQRWITSVFSFTLA